VDANNKNAHYNMGVVYFIGLKKYDLAIKEYTDAITIEPKFVEGYYARGVCYKTKGDIKKAIADYDACLAINPDFEPAKESLKGFKK
jgi:tetratricopeptide (TPR) repeat protein